MSELRDGPNNIVQIGAADELQRCQDAAVATALQRLVGTRLPVDKDVRVILTDKPGILGITQANLARAEEAAFEKARYGQRAEGLAHFENVFRGYTWRGPLRYVIIAEIGGGSSEVLVFGDYFQVYDGYSKLGEAYADAAKGWRTHHPDQNPYEFITSKFVTNPNKRSAAAGLIGLGGLALAATLQGLSESNPEGIFMAARTQPASRRLIEARLPRLVPGLELLLNQPAEGAGAGGAQALMLAHVAHPGDEEVGDAE